MDQPVIDRDQPDHLEKLPGLLDQLRGGLIVSCQAELGEPLFGSEHMAAITAAAVLGGAAGIRANTPKDIAAISKVQPLDT